MHEGRSIYILIDGNNLMESAIKTFLMRACLEMNCTLFIYNGYQLNQLNLNEKISNIANDFLIKK